MREEVVDSNQLLDVEFDENSLRGVLDQYNWYPQAMKREYGPCRIWIQDKMFPPMNDVRRHWWKHYTNEFDHNTNLYILLKKMYCPHRHEQPTKIMTKWFKHITNNVATNHWAKTTKPLLPSAHLNIEIDSDQYSFLNPTMQDVLLSTLEMDSYGDNAKKKRACRCMCMVDGSAKSYSKQLNSASRMDKYTDQNALIGILAALRLETDEAKKKAKEKKATDMEEKQRNKIANEIRKQQEKDNTMPSILEDINKGLAFVQSKNMPRLKQILLYYYNMNETELNKLKRNGLDALITTKMTKESNNVDTTTTYYNE